MARARRRSPFSRSAVRSNVAVRVAWVKSGNTSPAIRPMTPTTTSISRRVAPPSEAARSPVADILCLAGPTLGMVGAQGIDVDLAVLAGVLVEVLRAPGVGQGRGSLQIRPVPVGRR